MSALACYFDESNMGRHYTVAGYLGTAEVWNHVFTPAWKAVLQQAPHQLTEFKASDCRARRGEFAGWSRKECDALTIELISVIVEESDAEGYATVLRYPGVVADGHADSSKQRSLVERVSYTSGVFALLYDVLKYGTRFFPPGQLQPVADERRKFYRQLVDGYERARQRSGFQQRVAAPMPMRSHEHPPIQAADLLAYETRKEIENRVAGRPVSKALQRLVDSRSHFARCAEFLALGPEPATTALFHSGKPVRAKGNWGVP